MFEKISKFIICKFFGWHNCNIESNDGASNHGKCKRCGVECMQDSQGNWFKIEPLDKIDHITDILCGVLFIAILALIIYLILTLE